MKQGSAPNTGRGQGMLPRLLRQLIRPTTSDAALLHQFLEARDELAFGEIVRRHGPIVLRVCRRMVDASRAEDAFQATFLILATRANQVKRADSLGSWLVGVAGRVARQMRKADQRRGQHEQAAATERLQSERATESQPELAELSRILDEELTQLPDHLRAPVVACWVQGQTQEEAARELGSSVRTVRRRLDEARRRLQIRLQRRGIVPIISAAMLSGAGVGSASVPDELVVKTVQFVFDFLAGGLATTLPAALIAQGVVMSVLTRKVAMLLVTMALSTTAVGVSIGVGQDKAPKPGSGTIPTLPPVQKAPAPVSKSKSDDRTAPPKANPNPLLPSPQLELPPNTPTASPTDPTFSPPQMELPRAPAPRPDESKSTIESAPFHITAPDSLTARAIYHEATYLLAIMATKWTHRPYDMKQQIHIVAKHEAGEGHSATTFVSNMPGQRQITIQLAGSLENILRVQLPHEMMHVVLALTFSKQLPRWIDEGLAVMVEPHDQQVKHDQMCRDFVNSGEAVRLKYLLPMMEYPKNMKVAYAQGHSLVRFLLTRKPHDYGSPAKIEGEVLARTALMHFVNLGVAKEGWQNAARAVYGYDTLDEMEEAWMTWLQKPESVMKQPNEKIASLPELPRVESQTIPPPANRLPGGSSTLTPTGTYPTVPDVVRPSSPLVPTLPPSTR